MLPVVEVSSSMKLNSPVRIVETLVDMRQAASIPPGRIPGLGMVIGHGKTKTKVCLESPVRSQLEAACYKASMSTILMDGGLNG